MMKEYTYEQRHMGTDTVLSFICPTQSLADAIATSIFAQIREAEAEFSRFLPQSTLSTLNATSQAVVSQLFIEVLETALSLHALTAGVFNPLVQVATIGYTKPLDSLPATVPLTNSTYNTDVHAIKIDRRTARVTLQPGQQLDFGGILKGFLATKLANYVMATYPECTGCIINLGGDLATRGLDELHEPFIFLLYNPVTNEEIEIPLTDTSLATSGTYARYWQTNKGLRHHIVDAKTRTNPTSNLISASIIHSSGAVSEALTKLFIINGIQGAIDTLAPQHISYSYFCVATNGNVTSSIV